MRFLCWVGMESLFWFGVTLWLLFFPSPLLLRRLGKFVDLFFVLEKSLSCSHEHVRGLGSKIVDRKHCKMTPGMYTISGDKSNTRWSRGYIAGFNCGVTGLMTPSFFPFGRDYARC